MKLVKLAADQGHGQAQYFFGAARLVGHKVGCDETEGIRYIRMAADRDVAEAQSLLIHIIQAGLIPFDDAEAARYYRLAMRQGRAHMQFPFCRSLLYGLAAPQGEGRIAEVLTNLVEVGSVTLQFKVGTSLLHGLDVPRNEAEGTRLVKQAADGGHPNAKLTYGNLI